MAVRVLQVCGMAGTGRLVFNQPCCIVLPVHRQLVVHHACLTTSIVQPTLPVARVGQCWGKVTATSGMLFATYLFKPAAHKGISATSVGVPLP